jgi:opacity protein-like surface antigen
MLKFLKTTILLFSLFTLETVFAENKKLYFGTSAGISFLNDQFEFEDKQKASASDTYNFSVGYHLDEIFRIEFQINSASYNFKAVDSKNDNNTQTLKFCPTPKNNLYLTNTKIKTGTLNLYAKFISTDYFRTFIGLGVGYSQIAEKITWVFEYPDLYYNSGSKAKRVKYDKIINVTYGIETNVTDNAVLELRYITQILGRTPKSDFDIDSQGNSFVKNSIDYGKKPLISNSFTLGFRFYI